MFPKCSGMSVYIISLIFLSPTEPVSSSAKGSSQVRILTAGDARMRVRMTKIARGTRPMYQNSKSSWYLANSGATVRETMDINLMRMLRAGPDVSLNGSPTVSPTTQAFCCSLSLGFFDFFSPSFSQSFFELSHAPPALAIMSASMQPEAMAPASIPIKKRGPTRKPPMRGARIAYVPGAIISRTDERVEIATHLSESGTTSLSAGAFQLPSPCCSYFSV
mmetsp:Transcript_28782/g.71748  ORF Transcript_28782/g.71748 Transcript_28782/m.71748 type:complete len:220 (-) Transcript_28782:1806-2465(-)